MVVYRQALRVAVLVGVVCEGTRLRYVGHFASNRIRLQCRVTQGSVYFF